MITESTRTFRLRPERTIRAKRAPVFRAFTTPLSADGRDGHEEGWSSCLDKLEELFA